MMRTRLSIMLWTVLIGGGIVAMDGPDAKLWHQTGASNLPQILLRPTPKRLPEIPKDHFSPPVAHAMVLSGTFGELRPHHFHEGIDIKPKAGAGEPVYAAADGFVARIRTMPRGFGHVVYLRHPNGFTTVYAHLKTFSPLLQTYVRSAQYAKRTYETDLFPSEIFFPVKKGELIGHIGNTGSSSGAHLHFEIRETRTDTPLNPLLFGWAVQDTQPPIIRSIKWYALDRNGRELSARTVVLKKKDGFYVLPQDSLVCQADFVGLAVEADDLTNEKKNRLGIYQLELRERGQRIFSFVFNEISYEQTRYLNAHSDYGETQKKKWLHRCFLLPGNWLPIYGTDARRGVLPLGNGGALDLECVVSDIFGNASVAKIRLVQGKESPPTASPAAFDYQLRPQDSLRVRRPGFEVFLTSGSVYETVGLNYRAHPPQGATPERHQFGSGQIPLHHAISVGILPDPAMDAAQRSKAVIMLNGTKSLGGVWRNGWLWTQTHFLGQFSIGTDVNAPTVSPAGKFKDHPRVKERLVLHGSDDLSGLRDYHAYLDGEWMLMEYDQKTATLILPFENPLEKGMHQVCVEVTDQVGNQGEWSGVFEVTE